MLNPYIEKEKNGRIIKIIPNFDPKKSYPLEQSNIKSIPVYPTKCSCYYGWNCDDEQFDYSNPIDWIDVSLDDPRTYVYD